MEAMPVTPVFLALEPDCATTERIRQYKQQVRNLVGEQLYLDHPPHLTLFLAAFDDVGEVIASTRRLVRELTAPSATITGWHTFVSDPLTGNNTLVLDFTTTDQERLRQMQTRIIECLSPYRDRASSLDRINGRWTHLSKEERNAAEKYGFPYVGKGWHPHFTIASIRPTDWPIIERELFPVVPTGKLTCPRIQLFQLIDNDPVLLESFDLPQPTALKETISSHEPVRNSCALKAELTEAIWSVVDQHEWILSATLTGSFLTDHTIAAISDIDLVLIVDALTGPRFDSLQEEFIASLTPPLAKRNLKLRINSTLGPRKLNDDATAVLHLMLYSREGHHQHVINSPFTCFDWQRSSVHRNRSMAEVYPVFGLQPHHFVSARRGLRDYLRDFERSVVSYREIECSAYGCTEVKREEPMSTRGRYEYAYHVMRFLMQNLLKLVQRSNRIIDGAALIEEFAAIFAQNVAEYSDLYRELRWRKARRDFSTPIPRLDERLTAFVIDFESQFRYVFEASATRHIFFRHAPTALNVGSAGERRFQGRLNEPIQPHSLEQFASLISALDDFPVDRVYTSPLQRCRQSLEVLRNHVPMPQPIDDARLLEIDYGSCDGLSIAEARQRHSKLFTDWSEGDDPRFPEGENTADVFERLKDFLAREDAASNNSIVCTHNVVLRCLVGEGLGVPRSRWHQIEIPHLAPMVVVQTRNFGWYIDLEESVERKLLANFLLLAQEAA